MSYGQWKTVTEQNQNFYSKLFSQKISIMSDISVVDHDRVI